MNTTELLQGTHGGRPKGFRAELLFELRRIANALESIDRKQPRPPSALLAGLAGRMKRRTKEEVMEHLGISDPRTFEKHAKAAGIDPSREFFVSLHIGKIEEQVAIAHRRLKKNLRKG